MTIFLTALFMMAINEEMSKMQKKKPVVLMVPVNLRKFFPSSSMLNFFNWIEPGYNFTTQDQSFEAVLKYTKEFFETELTKEKNVSTYQRVTSTGIASDFETCAIGT